MDAELDKSGSIGRVTSIENDSRGKGWVEKNVETWNRMECGRAGAGVIVGKAFGLPSRLRNRT